MLAVKHTIDYKNTHSRALYTQENIQQALMETEPEPALQHANTLLISHRVRKPNLLKGGAEGRNFLPLLPSFHGIFYFPLLFSELRSLGVEWLGFG